MAVRSLSAAAAVLVAGGMMHGIPSNPFKTVAPDVRVALDAIAQGPAGGAGAAALQTPQAGPFKAIGPDVRIGLYSVVSPDGTRLIEDGGGQDASSVVLRDLTTSHRQVIARGTGPGTADMNIATPGYVQVSAQGGWSPDGTRIALVSTESVLSTVGALGNPLPQPGGRPAPSLRIVSVATGDARTILTLPVFTMLTIRAWTTKDEIFYSVSSPGASATDLFLLPSSGGQPRKILTLEAGPNERTRFGNIAPDGASIVVVQSDHLVSVDLATGDETPLAPDIPAAYPQISPDGRLLAFLSRQDGSWAVCVAPLDERPIRKPVRVATVAHRGQSAPDPAGWQAMQWGPGGKLTFDYRDEQHDLYRVNTYPKTGWAAGPPERLTRESDAVGPVISPDSTQIAFALPSSRPSRASAVSVMRSDGGDAHALVDLPSRLGPQTYAWKSADELLFAKMPGGGPIPNPAELGMLNRLQVGTRTVAPLPNAVPVTVFAFIPARNDVLYVPSFVNAARPQGGRAGRAGLPLGRNQNPGLWLRSLTDGAERLLVEVQSTPMTSMPIWDFSVSRDDRQVAYWLRAPGPTGGVVATLHVVSIDGGEDKVLLSRRGPAPSLGGRLAWSSDQTRLLYQDGDLRVLDIATGESRALLDKPIPQWLGPNVLSELEEFDWAPNGAFVVFGLRTEATYRLGWEGVTYDAVKKLQKQ